MLATLSEIARTQDTDKAQSPGYIENFERHFERFRDQPVRLLELGVFRGGSLWMWHEYFQRGLIVGLDLKPCPISALPERIRFYQGSQDDSTLLDRVRYETAPDGFDIVIDDASHVGELSRKSYNNLFHKHLKSGGIYVVEDWGTGYWHTWPDGKIYQAPNAPNPNGEGESFTSRALARLGWSGRPEVDPTFSAHNFGMVGFVKELVDEVAWPDITAPRRGNASLQQRPSTIRELTIYNGHAFIIKA